MDESGTNRKVRVTVEEAARLLGIEKQSVKKRIQRGKLRFDKDASGTTWVYVDTSETVQDQSRDQSDTGMDALVEELRRQNEYLRSQLDQEREANRENRRLLAGLIERVPELEAPREPSEASEPVQEEPERAEPRSGTEGPQRGAQRPWWRRVLGR